VNANDDAASLRLWRDMLALRVYDERSVAYHRQGRIGTYAISWGHEAIQAGAVAALEPRDWIFPSYRESAIGILRGLPRATVLAWWRGHPAGWWSPDRYGVASICVPIATHIPHAAGFAWGSRLRGEDRVAMAFFGDGATSEGAFHEGVNLAAVMRAPVVFVCNNNGWAISTPIERQTRAETLASKAAGYGIPGVRVDGGDVLAVHEATRDAVARARAGEGPTLVECVTYRMAPHATADDPSLYVDEGRVARERENECLLRFERLLRGRGILDDAAIEAARTAELEAMREAISIAEALEPPGIEVIFDRAYAAPPPELAREHAELRRILAQEAARERSAVA
jgi:pyruvate dehydrogenase E1 component alpha subunit